MNRFRRGRRDACQVGGLCRSQHRQQLLSRDSGGWTKSWPGSHSSNAVYHVRWTSVGGGRRRGRRPWGRWSVRKSCRRRSGIATGVCRGRILSNERRGGQAEDPSLVRLVARPGHPHPPRLWATEARTLEYRRHDRAASGTELRAGEVRLQLAVGLEMGGQGWKQRRRGLATERSPSFFFLFFLGVVKQVRLAMHSRWVPLT